MSTLLVNQVRDNSNNLLLDSSGSIIQVASAYSRVSGEITTTSTSYVSSGFNLSFKPKKSNSTLHIIVSFNGKFIGGTGDDGAGYRVYRNGSALVTGGSEYDQVLYRSDSNGASHHLPVTICHSITSGNTNSSVFELYFVNFWGGTTVINGIWGQASMTIMEVT